MKTVACLILFLAAAFAGVPACYAVTVSAPCASQDLIAACSSAGKVSVSGDGHSSGHAGSYSTPVGATQLVSCGDGTEAALTSLGEATAATDAGQCPQYSQDCQEAANQAVPTKNRSATIQVEYQGNGTWTYDGVVCVDNQQARAAVTAAEVRQQAIRLIPASSIGIAPHTATLVNIQTIMWVTAPRTRVLPTVDILGRPVQITVTIANVQWSFGDGQSATSSSPGKAYSESSDPCRTVMCPGYFGHVYRTTGNDTVRATVNWTANFTVGGGPGAAIPGTIAGPTATAPLAVKQARGILVPNAGGN